ncbi:MAG: tetratricopeptide repeat protein, partial [Halioglobus sp.]|nr:tetratricopeptide repeat protein [Halioglobus sp.]
MPNATLTRLLLSFALAMALSWSGAYAASVLDRAITLAEQGKVQEAEIAMKQGLQENPDDPELRYLLGKLYLDNYYAEGAAKELMRAREGGMPEELVLYPLGRAYLLQQKYSEVLSDFPDSLEYHAELRAQVLTLRALASLGLGDRNSAKQGLRAALLLNPKNRDTQIASARVSIASGEFAAARELLDTLV